MPSLITVLAITLVAANAAQLPEPSIALAIEPSMQVQAYRAPVCYDYERPQDHCNAHYNNTQSKRAKKKKRSKRTNQESAKMPFTPKKNDSCNKRHAECMQSESIQDSARGANVRQTLNPVALNWINALNVSNSLLGRLDRCNDAHTECITQD